MAKIVMVIPTEDMLSDALSAAELANVDAQVYVEKSATVLERVRQAQQEGALVAIARGNHANLILKQLNIPLVEIRLTGQSIAELIVEARQLTDKPRPKIAFVGFRNMLSEMHVFEPILDVVTVEYLVESSEDIRQAVYQAKNDEADVIIGGEISLEVAREVNLPAVFLRSSKDSLVSAFQMARRLQYAIEMEKKNTVEVTTLLNYSFDGIIRLDLEGRITTVNYMVERIFRRAAKDLIGQEIANFFDEQDSNIILECLKRRKQQQSLMLHHGSVSLIANLAVLTVNGSSEGAILSFQEFGTIEAMEEIIRQDRYSRVQRALRQFTDLVAKSPAYSAALDQAQRFAPYEQPISLLGEVGTGKRTLAECIHNASLRRNNPFVAVDCAGMPEGMQDILLSADEASGAFKKAHTGTLFIDNIDRLTQAAQYQLLSALRDGLIWQPDRVKALPVNVRVIGAGSRNLFALAMEGAFSLPLYTMLSQFEIHVPALRDRQEDFQDILDRYIERYCTKYRKYIVLTPEARQVVAQYAWPGNLMQLDLYAEKLTLLSDERVVSADFALHCLPRSFAERKVQPKEQPAPPQQVVYSTPEAELILRLLEKHEGKRAQVAMEMGISKTTLWRKMNRHGIEGSFKL